MQPQANHSFSRRSHLPITLLGIALALFEAPALAFVSGSTGADGAFSPTVNTQVQLPPSGVFNYTTINIPGGVTVTFAKNTTNTPVVMLATGNVTIAGTIDISGTDGAPVGTTGGGALGDDGNPGVGGPGGFSGGRGGGPGSPYGASGGNGLGPGGGEGGFTSATYPAGYYAGSAGYAADGAGGITNVNDPRGGNGGKAYGSPQLLPLIGGSGGGGGPGGTSFAGSGGGGGGGAILIASSGTISITGQILAYGAGGGAVGGTGSGYNGGCGSGGGVRLVATTISGTGPVRAYSTPLQGGSCPIGAGSSGFIRMEAETFTYTGSSSPAHSFAAPGPVFIAGQPTVSITSVGGSAVPANPTGVGDVQLPANTVNPVTVNFQTTGIPVGNTIKLTVTPASGAGSTVTSSALTGSTSVATASVSATLPAGPSTLLATVTYTIVASLGDMMSTFAENQRVERVEVTAALGGRSQVSLITANGRRYPAPPAALAMLYGQVAASGS